MTTAEKMTTPGSIHAALVDGDGICQRPEHRPTASTPSLWEGLSTGERRGDVAARHVQAKIECLRCPLLRACEAMLSDSEKSGDPVDGVVAGRYSDCAIDYSCPDHRQRNCRTCGQPMYPQRWLKKNPEATVERVHSGEGLCNGCYSLFSRWSR